VQSELVGGACNKLFLIMVKAEIFERNSLDSQTRTVKECAYKGDLQAKFSKYGTYKISATETTCVRIARPTVNGCYCRHGQDSQSLHFFGLELPICNSFSSGLLAKTPVKQGEKRLD